MSRYGNFCVVKDGKILNLLVLKNFFSLSWLSYPCLELILLIYVSSMWNRGIFVWEQVRGCVCVSTRRTERAILTPDLGWQERSEECLYMYRCWFTSGEQRSFTVAHLCWEALTCAHLCKSPHTSNTFGSFLSAGPVNAAKHGKGSRDKLLSLVVLKESNSPILIQASWYLN